MSNQFELTVTQVVPASREAVFEAWLNPEALASFMKPLEGMTVPNAEVDGREGGAYLILMKAGDEEMPHTGVYKTVNRFERLAFTWVDPWYQGDSLVTLDFEALGPAETKLTLHHVGFSDQEACDSHHGGWTTIVGHLSSTVA